MDLLQSRSSDKSILVYFHNDQQNDYIRRILTYVDKDHDFLHGRGKKTSITNTLLSKMGMKSKIKKILQGSSIGSLRGIQRGNKNVDVSKDSIEKVMSLINLDGTQHTDLIVNGSAYKYAVPVMNSYQWGTKTPKRSDGKNPNAILQFTNYSGVEEHKVQSDYIKEEMTQYSVLPFPFYNGYVHDCGLNKDFCNIFVNNAKGERDIMSGVTDSSSSVGSDKSNITKEDVTYYTPFMSISDAISLYILLICNKDARKIEIKYQLKDSSKPEYDDIKKYLYETAPIELSFDDKIPGLNNIVQYASGKKGCWTFFKNALTGVTYSDAEKLEMENTANILDNFKMIALDIYSKLQGDLPRLNKNISSKDDFVIGFIYALKTFGDFSRLLDTYTYSVMNPGISNTILVTCDTFLKRIANYTNVPYIYGNKGNDFSFYNKGDKEANDMFIVSSFESKWEELEKIYTNGSFNGENISKLFLVYNSLYDIIDKGTFESGRSRRSKKFVLASGESIDDIDKVKIIVSTITKYALFIIEIVQQLIILDLSKKFLMEKVKYYSKDIAGKLTIINQLKLIINTIEVSQLTHISEVITSIITNMDTVSPIVLLDSIREYISYRCVSKVPGEVCDNDENVEYTIEERYERIIELNDILRGSLQQPVDSYVDTILTSNVYRLLSMNNLEDLGITKKLKNKSIVFINPLIDYFNPNTNGGYMKGGKKKIQYGGSRNEQLNEFLQEYPLLITHNLIYSIQELIVYYKNMKATGVKTITLELLKDIYVLCDNILTCFTIINTFIREYIEQQSAVEKLFTNVITKYIVGQLVILPKQFEDAHNTIINLMINSMFGLSRLQNPTMDDIIASNIHTLHVVLDKTQGQDVEPFKPFEQLIVKLNTVLSSLGHLTKELNSIPSIGVISTKMSDTVATGSGEMFDPSYGSGAAAMTESQRLMTAWPESMQSDVKHFAHQHSVGMHTRSGAVIAPKRGGRTHKKKRNRLRKKHTKKRTKRIIKHKTRKHKQRRKQKRLRRTRKK